MNRFPSMEEFYNHTPARRTSPEADFGAHWRTEGHRHPHRVSYVKDTGEVYAVCLDGWREAAVRVLGTVPPDPVEPGSGELYYGTLNSVLEGCAEACLNQEDVSWVTSRLEAAGYGRKGTEDSG